MALITPSASEASRMDNRHVVARRDGAAHGLAGTRAPRSKHGDTDTGPTERNDRDCECLRDGETRLDEEDPTPEGETHVQEKRRRKGVDTEQRGGRDRVRG